MFNSQCIIPLDPNQPPIDRAKTVAALRACGVPRTQAKQAARDITDRAKVLRGVVGAAPLTAKCTQVDGGWVLEIFIPRAGLTDTQAEMVEALAGSSVARVLGRLQ